MNLYYYETVTKDNHCYGGIAVASTYGMAADNIIEEFCGDVEYIRHLEEYPCETLILEIEKAKRIKAVLDEEFYCADKKTEINIEPEVATNENVEAVDAF